MKCCSVCKENKDLDEFYLREGGLYGRTAICKECLKIQRRAYKSKGIGKIRRKFRERLSRKFKITSNRYSPMMGCSCNKLKEHISNQFYGGMTWENRGEVWCLDHIIPVSAFDILNPKDRTYINHYLNLRPVLVGENKKKYMSFTALDKENMIAAIIADRSKPIEKYKKPATPKIPRPKLIKISPPRLYKHRHLKIHPPGTYS